MTVIAIAGSPLAASGSTALLNELARLRQRQGVPAISLAVRNLPAEDLIFGRRESLALKEATRYIRRTMPMDRPQSLTADEVYAISAYLLNGLASAEALIDAASLAAVQMPNRNGFVRPPRYPGGALHDRLQVNAALSRQQ